MGVGSILYCHYFDLQQIFCNYLKGMYSSGSICCHKIVIVFSAYFARILFCEMQKRHLKNTNFKETHTYSNVINELLKRKPC